MHLLRDPAETMRYRGFVESLVEVSSKSGDVSGREKDAVLSLCTAYMKLFFPHANNELIQDRNFKHDFDKYCLQPAKTMQETVLRQMKIINPGEFENIGFATYKVRYVNEEQIIPSFPMMQERMVIDGD
jgi:ATP-dependent Lon protease